MVSVVSAIRQLNLNLVTEFESNIEADEKACRLWKEVKPFFDHSTVRAFGDASQVFSKVLKLTQSISKDEVIKNIWIKLLREGEFYYHPEAHSKTYTYHFDSIATLVEKAQNDFDIEVIEVDPNRDDLKKIADEINQMYIKGQPSNADHQEMLGKILPLPRTNCFLAKCGDITVGCLITQLLTIQRIDQKVNVLFFMMLCRKAEYPSVRFVEHLSKLLEGRLKKVDGLDYLSFCVLPGNSHAIDIYRRLGFSDFDPIMATRSGQPLLYSAKKVEGSPVTDKPTHAEVVAAFDD